MHDPIADMIIRIKNASNAGKESVVLPYSKMKLSVLDVLKREGFIGAVGKKGKEVTKWLEVNLIHDEAHGPKINGLERVSKASKRIYTKAKDVKRVKNGFGALILSTPKGIMTDKEAKQANIGGEALFKIW